MLRKHLTLEASRGWRAGVQMHTGPTTASALSLEGTFTGVPTLTRLQTQ